VFLSKTMGFGFKFILNMQRSLETDHEMVYNVTGLLFVGRSPRTSDRESLCKLPR
jgi:hypothetical protein